MKKETIFVILLIMLISFVAATRVTTYTVAEEDEKKFCNENSDCSLRTDISYKGECSSGCFASDIETNSTCSEEEKEGNCACIQNKCVLTREESEENEDDDSDNEERENNSREKIREQIREELREAIQERKRINFENLTGESCLEDCNCRGVIMTCPLEDGGRKITIYAESGNRIIQTKGINATTKVTLYHHNGTIIAELENGTIKEIKITPDQVREKLRERIKARIERQNITLDEDGNYHIEANKRARLFFIFSVNENVRYKVDSETGETKRVGSSWWGWLARDVENTEGNDENTDTNNETES